MLERQLIPAESSPAEMYSPDKRIARSIGHRRQLSSIVDPEEVNSSQIIIAGYLAKKSDVLRSWKAKYFELWENPPTLKSYEVPGGASSGDFLIGPLTEVKAIQFSRINQYRFEIKFPSWVGENSIIFFALSDSERSQWMKAIEELVFKVKSNPEMQKSLKSNLSNFFFEKLPESLVEKIQSRTSSNKSQVPNSDSLDANMTKTNDVFNSPDFEKGPFSPNSLLKRMYNISLDRAKSCHGWNRIQAAESVILYQDSLVTDSNLFKLCMQVDLASIHDFFNLLHDVRLWNVWSNDIFTANIHSSLNEETDIISLEILRQERLDREIYSRMKILRYWSFGESDRSLDFIIHKVSDDSQFCGDFKIKNAAIHLEESAKQRFSDPLTVFVSVLVEIEESEKFYGPINIIQNFYKKSRHQSRLNIFKTLSENLVVLAHLAKALNSRLLKISTLLPASPSDIVQKNQIPNEKEVRELQKTLVQRNIKVPCEKFLSRLLKGNGNIVSSDLIEKVKNHWTYETMYDILSLSPEDFIEEIRSGVCVVHNFDKVGRPLLFIDISKHYSKHQSRTHEEHLNISIKYIILMMEYACALIPPDQEQIVIVVDVKNMGFKNFDSSLAEKMSKILDVRYCERVAVIYILNAGFIFRSLWEGIQVFLPADTTQKIFILSNGAKAKAKLLINIEEKDLPAMYDGQDDKFSYFVSENEFIDTWKSLKNSNTLNHIPSLKEVK